MTIHLSLGFNRKLFKMSYDLRPARLEGKVKVWNIIETVKINIINNIINIFILHV